MRWLLDNNVPRSVRYVLSDAGYEVLEVRQVLGPSASDASIAAYADAQRFVVATHDRGLARRCLQARIPHLWLRTREPQDRDRLAATLPEVLRAFEQEAVRVVLRRTAVEIPAPPETL